MSARPCDEDDWQCDKPCNKILPCGFHRCERICHDKACGNCPRSGERSCPCGKSSELLDRHYNIRIRTATDTIIKKAFL